MVIVFVIIVSLARFKQEITRDHLKDCTSQAPHISWGVIISTYNYLWRTILSSLNLWRKVMICPAAVTHIAYLYHDIFINFGASLILTRLLSSSASIVKLVIIIEKVSNRFVNAIKTTFLCMTSCLFLWFSSSLLWLLVLFYLVCLLFIISLLALIITAIFIPSCSTLILLLLSLLLFL